MAAGGGAAGAVRVDANEPARFDHVTTGRAAIFTGGRPIRLPDHRDGWRWEPYAVDGTDVDAARQQLQRLMRDDALGASESSCWASPTREPENRPGQAVKRRASPGGNVCYVVRASVGLTPVEVAKGAGQWRSGGSTFKAAAFPT